MAPDSPARTKEDNEKAPANDTGIWKDFFEFSYAVRPDLRLDDERDFRTDKGQPTLEALHALAKVKVRDFALQPNKQTNPTPKLCVCDASRKYKQEWNIILKANGRPAIPIPPPKQVIVGGSQSQSQHQSTRTQPPSNVPTEPPSRAPTQTPSNVPTEPSSPVPTADTPTFMAKQAQAVQGHALSRQPDPFALAEALATVDMTLKVHTIVEADAATEARTRTPSPAPAKRSLPVARGKQRAQDRRLSRQPNIDADALAPKGQSTASTSNEATTSTTVDPPTEPNSPAPAFASFAIPSMSVMLPRTPLNATLSLIFGRGSPLTPLPLTPNGSGSVALSFNNTLKRKRSTPSMLSVASNNNLRRKISKEGLAGGDVTRPNKRARKTNAKAVAPTTRTTRSQASKVQTTTTNTTPTANTSGLPRPAPTASTRLRRATASSAKPSKALKTSNKVGANSKLTKAKPSSKVTQASARQGRSLRSGRS